MGIIRRLLTAAQSRKYCEPRKEWIQIGDIFIPEGMQFEHMIVCGSPGAGKSTLIRQMLRQVRERGDSAVVSDIDAESTMEFADEDCVVLNPLDQRMPYWDISKECRAETGAMDRESMAASLVRGNPRDAAQEYYLRSARTVVESILQQAGTDLGKITELVNLPHGDLHCALEGTPAYPLVDPELRETGQTIVSVAVNALKPFNYLPRSIEEAGGREWTSREWVKNRQGIILMPSTTDAQAAIQSLPGVFLDCLVRWLMSEEVGSEKSTWVFADELPAWGFQPQIKQLVSRGRKRRIAAILGFQSISQLREIYGRDGAVTLTSSPITKVILRTDEPESARWCSDLIGSHEVERLQASQLAGLSSYREGITLNPHRSVELLVLPAEIQKLRKFSGYICIAGMDRAPIRIPEMHLLKRHDAFIPRITVAPPATTPAQPEPDEPSDEELAAQIFTRPTQVTTDD